MNNLGFSLQRVSSEVPDSLASASAHTEAAKACDGRQNRCTVHRIPTLSLALIIGSTECKLAPALELVASPPPVGPVTKWHAALRSSDQTRTLRCNSASRLVKHRAEANGESRRCADPENVR